MRWIVFAAMTAALALGCTAPIVPMPDAGRDAGVDAAMPVVDSSVDAAIPLIDSSVDAAVPLIDSGIDAGGTDAGTSAGFAVTGSLGTLGGVVSGSTFQVLGGQLESIGSSCAGTVCVTGRVGP